MTPVLFINCKDVPYVDLIIAREKVLETRSKNTLKALIGKQVYIAETGNGQPRVRCCARIGMPIEVRNQHDWDRFYPLHRVPFGSAHDWLVGGETTVKYLYPLIHAEPVREFTPPEGKRHGRVWMEYDETY